MSFFGKIGVQTKAEFSRRNKYFISVLTISFDYLLRTFRQLDESKRKIPKTAVVQFSKSVLTCGTSNYHTRQITFAIFAQNFPSRKYTTAKYNETVPS